MTSKLFKPAGLGLIRRLSAQGLHLILIITGLLSFAAGIRPAQAAPQRIAQSGSEYPSGSAGQRRVFFDETTSRHFAFFHDGSALKIAHSADSLNWTEAATSLPAMRGDFAVSYANLSGRGHFQIARAISGAGDLVYTGCETALDAARLPLLTCDTDSGPVFSATDLAILGEVPTLVTPALTLSGDTIWLSVIARYDNNNHDNSELHLTAFPRTAPNDPNQTFKAQIPFRHGHDLPAPQLLPGNGTHQDDLLLLASITGGTIPFYHCFKATHPRADCEFAPPAGNPDERSWYRFGGASAVSGIKVMQTDSRGNVYVAGTFKDLGGNPDADLIAYWDSVRGSWENLGAGLAGSGVSTIFLVERDVGPAGKVTTVFAGGAFSGTGETTNSTVLHNLAYWDGASWRAAGEGLESKVVNSLDYATVGSQAYLYVAGGSANGFFRRFFADPALSNFGTTENAGLDFANGVNSIIARNDGTAYVGGAFSNLGVPSNNFLAIWDPATSSVQVSDYSGGAVKTMALDRANNRLLIAPTSGSLLYRRQGDSWETPLSTTPLGTFDTGTIGHIAVSSGAFYLAGSFTTAYGGNFITRYVPGTGWTSVASLDPATSTSITAVAFSQNGQKMYLAGNFRALDQQPGADYFTELTADEGAWTLSSPYSSFGDLPAFNGLVDVIREHQGIIYAGGDFTDVGGDPDADYLVQWAADQGRWVPVGYGLDGPVKTLISTSSGLYVAGKFSAVWTSSITSGTHTSQAGSVQLWQPDQTWLGMGHPTGTAADIYAMAYHGGYLYAGVPNAIYRRTNYTEWELVGNLSGAGANPAIVYAMQASTLGTIYLAGSFTSGGNCTAYCSGLIALDASSNPTDASLINWSEVSAIGFSTLARALYLDEGNDSATSDDDVLYVGGYFTNAGGVVARNIARLVNVGSGGTWEALGAGLNNPVHAIHKLPDGNGTRLLVGGSFTADGSADQTNALQLPSLALWDTAASQWHPVNGGTNGYVRTVAPVMLAGSRAIFVGGSFTMAGIGDKPSYNLGIIAASAAEGAEGAALSAAKTSTATHLLLSTGEQILYRTLGDAGYGAPETVFDALPFGDTFGYTPDSPAISVDETHGDVQAAWLYGNSVYHRRYFPLANQSTPLSRIPLSSGLSTNSLSLTPNFSLGRPAVLYWTNREALTKWILAEPMPYSIRGRITGLEAAQLNSVSVTASSAGRADLSALGPDADGYFTLTGLDHGVIWTVKPTLPNISFTPPVRTVSDWTQSVDFTAGPGFNLTGSVTLVPPATGKSVTIRAVPHDPRYPDLKPVSTTVPSGSSYTLSGFPADSQWTVTAELPGYRFNAALIPFTADMTLDFTGIANTLKLSGAVFSADGAPVAGLRVALIDEATGDLRFAPDLQNGNFLFSGLRYGARYRVIPAGPGYSLSPTEQTVQLTPSDTEQPTVLPPFTATSNTPVTVSGRVTSEGRGLPGVEIDGGNLGTAATDEQGAYSFPAVTADTAYTLKPAKVGYTFAPAFIEGRATTDVTGQNFRAVRKTFTLSGAVRRAGRPVPGVVIDGGRLGRRATDRQGRYSFEDLRAGTEYLLTARQEGSDFNPETISGTLESNVTSANFTIPTATIFGDAIWRASTTSSAREARAASGSMDGSAVAISANGRYVAFSSLAAGLSGEDENGLRDVFLKDRDTSLVEILSIDPNGKAGNAESGAPVENERAISISAHPTSLNETYTAFTSAATNLDTPDQNGATDIFLYDSSSRTVSLISRSQSGTQGDRHSTSPALSPDGKVLAFASEATNFLSQDLNETSDIFLKNLQTGALTRASVSTDGAEADGPSTAPALSANGMRVVFVSSATNLDLPADDSNGVDDIYLRDLEAQTTTRISVRSGQPNADGRSMLPAISADGKVIAFASEATNLVDGDNNGVRDVFVLKMNESNGHKDWRLTLVSRKSDTEPGNAGSGFGEISLSADGRFVSFTSDATNLVPNDTNNARDVFVFDTLDGATVLASKSVLEAQADADSLGAALSSDGKFAAFTSEAANLVSGDRNKVSDVFAGPVGPFPEAIAQDAPIQQPPTLVAQKGRVTILMKRYLLNDTAQAQALNGPLQSYHPETDRRVPPALRERASQRVNYKVTITNARKRNERSRRDSRRFNFTITDMRPGTYRVSYHAEVKSGNKVITRTKESPRRKFVISE